jgi:exosome complex RNA-binding protein Csl4
MCGYTCCGQPMQRDGSQLVCGKCGSWVDPGVSAAPVAAR